MITFSLPRPPLPVLVVTAIAAVGMLAIANQVPTPADARAGIEVPMPELPGSPGLDTPDSVLPTEWPTGDSLGLEIRDRVDRVDRDAPRAMRPTRRAAHPFAGAGSRGPEAPDPTTPPARRFGMAY